MLIHPLQLLLSLTQRTLFAEESGKREEGCI